MNINWIWFMVMWDTCQYWFLIDFGFSGYPKSLIYNFCQMHHSQHQNIIVKLSPYHFIIKFNILGTILIYLMALQGTNKVVAFKRNQLMQQKLSFGGEGDLSQSHIQPQSATIKGQKRQFKSVLERLKNQNKDATRNQEDQNKKDKYQQANLKLGDYLKLNILSHKHKIEGPDKRRSSSQPTQLKHLTKLQQKKISSLNVKDGIIMVQNQIKQEFQDTQKQLKKVLKQIEDCSQIKEDEQSLVFMCNILNVFQERICQTTKMAQSLIEKRKKKQDIQKLKNYQKELSKNNSPPKKSKERKKLPLFFSQSSAFITK